MRERERFKAVRSSASSLFLAFMAFNSSSSNDSLVYLWTKFRLRDGLTYEHYEHYIDSVASLIDESQRLNFIRWPVLDVELPFGTGIRYTYENEVKFLKETLKTRLEWMDQHVGIDPTLVCEKGDVNNDGHINLADVVAGATFVQGQSVEGYVRQSADMNDDGKVARIDLTLLVNELFSKETPDLPVDATQGLSLSLTGSELRAGEEGVLKLSCNSSVTSVGALQFDITLPEGVELEEVTRTSNLMSIYNVIMRPLAGNSYRGHSGTESEAIGRHGIGQLRHHSLERLWFTARCQGRPVSRCADTRQRAAASGYPFRTA